MRSGVTFAALFISAALSLPAGAAVTAQQTNMKTCAATWKTMSAADQAKTKYTAYMGTCMKSAAAPAPAAAMAAQPAPAASAMKTAAPATGGSAKCKDGKTVMYKVRSGTCSGHGGVATWM